jgi:hypothetical protein
MAWNLFGFQIGKPDVVTVNQPSPIIPITDDGSSVLTVGGSAFGVALDTDPSKNEVELITKYREMAITPEAEQAVDEVVNESIVMEDNRPPVNLVTDNLRYSINLKRTIADEFETILRLLDFNNIGYQLFRKWYIDGRLFFHIIIDETKPELGIQEVRYIDPRKIRKIKEIRKAPEKQGGVVVDVINDYVEYFVYNDKGINAISNMGVGGIRFAADSIAYVPSGLIDTNGSVISYLHKAIKPLNQLRMLEDALVIYRMSRAPERRIFYIDVGQMPPAKAEAFVKSQIALYRNKLVYDAKTGEIRDDKKHMNMLEDFWMPRREGGKGTQVEVLKSGENLGKMDDIEYFQEKLYRSLGVPVSRLKQDGFSLGRASEISRDEVKFFKFVFRLRKQFSELFDTLLSTQLRLKGVINNEDWEDIRKDLSYDFQKDSYFTELKESEMLRERMNTFIQVQEQIGRIFSQEYVEKNILKLTDKQRAEMKAQMAKEGPPELPAGTTLGMPVGMPGTDYAPPGYASQDAQFGKMVALTPGEQFQQIQQEVEAKQVEAEKKAAARKRPKPRPKAKTKPKKKGTK